MDISLANRRNPVLFATSISYIMVILDTSILNVALPRIGEDLNISITSLQWVVNSYTVIFSSLLLSGGALGDRYGTRLMYMYGLVVFIMASLVCGLTSGLPSLIVGRILQGIGAAVLVPCALSLLTLAHDNQFERSRAMAIWASWGGGALALGPLIGGLIVELFTWRAIFLINIPIGLLGIFLLNRVEVPQILKKGIKLDWLGQISAFLTISSLIFSLIEGPVQGWTSPAVVAGAIVSLLAAGIFVVASANHSSPVLPLHLFKNRNFSAISYVFFAGALSFFGNLFLLSFYFQEVKDFSALETGVALLPLSLCVIVGNKISGRLLMRYGQKRLMLVGVGLRIFGFFGLLLAITADAYWLLILPLCSIGIGGGLGAPMSTSLFMSSVSKSYVGIASGVSRATGQLGSAFGIALFGGLILDADRFVSQMGVSLSIITIATISIFVVVLLFVDDTPHAQS